MSITYFFTNALNLSPFLTLAGFLSSRQYFAEEHEYTRHVLGLRVNGTASCTSTTTKLLSRNISCSGCLTSGIQMLFPWISAPSMPCMSSNISPFIERSPRQSFILYFLPFILSIMHFIRFVCKKRQCTSLPTYICTPIIHGQRRR